MSTAASLGDVLEIDDRTILVLGQVLDVAHDQPDVANALVHRAGEVLFLVDTGVTTAIRDALRAAVDRVGPWSRLVVLTTHGHPDRAGEVRAGPQALRAPVVLDEVGELLWQTTGGDVLEAVDQLRGGDL